jgi:GDP/UDP-N,N'-diacetylbacillosamine 2-epimerase (hydrolysing)
MVKRKICVFTGTRAEYGLLKPLMDEIEKDKALCLQLVVSGMHLSSEFGLTYKQIEEDGFVIDEKLEVLVSSDTAVGVSKSMGLGLISFGEAYARLKPDIVVVLGDRFEAFAAAGAAMISRIPIAHLHGGEATFGLIDEAIRHCITKMSHLHFTSTEEYRDRVIQLGEAPDRVFNVGATGLDNIVGLELLGKEELESELNLKFNKRNLLVTYHPVTLEPDTSREQFGNLLAALDNLSDTHIIFTKANADTDGRVINQMIDQYVSANSHKSTMFTSMGQLRYLSTMQYVDAVVGNSSSGIIEAPSFKVGTVNIGDRQKGRIKAGSIVDCEPMTEDITRELEKVFSVEFKRDVKNVTNPHGDGGAAVKIKDILKNRPLENIIKKKFYDLKLREAVLR